MEADDWLWAAMMEEPRREERFPSTSRFKQTFSLSYQKHNCADEWKYSQKSIIIPSFSHFPHFQLPASIQLVLRHKAFTAFVQILPYIYHPFIRKPALFPLARRECLFK